jgi:acetylornithine deacetylase
VRRQKAEVKISRDAGTLFYFFLLTSAFCGHFRLLFSSHMDAITLTRQLVDIESISGNEAAVGNYLYGELCRVGYQTRRMPVEGDRFNVYATSPEQSNPEVVFSTHMDTVPPFIPSSEDAGRIYGRGSCDAKGIIAAQICGESVRAQL